MRMPCEIGKLLRGVGFSDVAVTLENVTPVHLRVGKKALLAIINIMTLLPYFRGFKRQIFAVARKNEIRDYYPGWLFMRGEGWLDPPC